MDNIKRYLLIIGVPLLCLVLGFAWELRAHRVLAPSGRFVATETSGVAMDSKTGQYCFAEPERLLESKDLPYCLDLYRKY